MRLIAPSLLVAASFLCSMGAANAQFFTQASVSRDFRELGPVTLLLSSAVPNDLSLTTEQKSKAKELAVAVRKQLPQPEDVRGKRGDERVAIVKRMQRAAGETADKGLRDLLSPDQYKRLHQIFFQANFLEGFTDFKSVYPSLDNLRRATELTDEQKSQFGTLLTEYRAARTELIGKGLRQNSPDTWKQVYDLRKAYQRKAIDSLTDLQKRNWSELIGPPFDLDKVFSVPESK
jgi:hypothetical protein